MLTVAEHQQVKHLLEKRVISPELSQLSGKGIIATYCCDDPRFLGHYIFTLTRIPLVHPLNLHGSALAIYAELKGMEHEHKALLRGIMRAADITGYQDLLLTIHGHCKMANILGIHDLESLITVGKKAADQVEKHLFDPFGLRVHLELQVYPPGEKPICFTDHPPKFAQIDNEGLMTLTLQKRFDIFRVVR